MMYRRAIPPGPRAPFSRGPVLGGVMVALALTAAITGRLVGASTTVPVSTVVTQRDLTFVDRADGGIDVRTAPDGKLVSVITGQNGFIRATMRGLAQQRKQWDVGAEVPFRLTAWADGRLTLDDPVTSRHVELEAFGQTNEEAFVPFLTAQAPSP